MKDSWSDLRDLAIALGVLALVFAALFSWAFLSGDMPQRVTSFLNPDVPKRIVAETPVSDEPVEPAEPEKEKEEIIRFVTGEHRVIGGESFSLITGMYWDDIFLWPDLYVLNDMKSSDPDIIYPDEIVEIYNRLGKGNVFSDAEKNMIMEAYLKVYRRYKAIGPEKNSSAWTLLWCGAKYNHDFLNIYADQIDPEDLKVARRYIEEEGFLD